MAADVLPGSSIAGTEIGELSLDGIAMGDRSCGTPESEAIVECARIFIFELNRPGLASVSRLVNSKISRLRTNGQQIGNFLAHPLHIAKLKRLCSRHDPGFPGLAAVGSDAKRSTAAGHPRHLRAHRTYCDQALPGAARFAGYGRLADSRWIFCKA